MCIGCLIASILSPIALGEYCKLCETHLAWTCKYFTYTCLFFIYKCPGFAR